MVIAKAFLVDHEFEELGGLVCTAARVAGEQVAELMAPITKSHESLPSLSDTVEGTAEIADWLSADLAGQARGTSYRPGGDVSDAAIAGLVGRTVAGDAVARGRLAEIYRRGVEQVMAGVTGSQDAANVLTPTIFGVALAALRAGQLSTDPVRDFEKCVAQGAASPKVYGVLLRHLRERGGWSLRQVAKNVGMNHTNLQRLEKNQETPQRYAAWGLLSALGVADAVAARMVAHFFALQAVEALIAPLVRAFFGQWLQKKRTEKGWTQAELAEKTLNRDPQAPPVGSRSVAHYEAGTRSPSVKGAELLVAVVGSTVQQARRDVSSQMIEAVLADLPMPTEHLEAILDHWVFGGPVTGVAQRLGVDADATQRLIDTVGQRLADHVRSAGDDAQGFTPQPITAHIDQDKVKPWSQYSQEEFARFVRDYRQASGLSQQQLSEHARIDRKTVNRTENPKVGENPRPGTVAKLVTALTGLSGYRLRQVCDHFFPKPEVHALMWHPTLLAALQRWLGDIRVSLGRATVRDMAEAIGHARPHVSKVELGTTTPSTDYVERSLDVLGLTVRQARDSIMLAQLKTIYPDLGDYPEFTDSAVMDLVRQHLSTVIPADSMTPILWHLAFPHAHPLPDLAARLQRAQPAADQLVETARHHLAADSRCGFPN